MNIVQVVIGDKANEFVISMVKPVLDNQQTDALTSVFELLETREKELREQVSFWRKNCVDNSNSSHKMAIDEEASAWEIFLFRIVSKKHLGIDKSSRIYD